MIGSVVIANLVLACSLLSAVPPLTDAQNVQLNSATDYNRVYDQGALYPLMRNAAQWDPNDQAGAVIPDYHAIRTNPADHRGRLFLIEGAFQRAIPAGKYAQPGPWQGRAQQWVVQWGQQFQDVAVIELIDPPDHLHTPTRGQPVRLIARFYKVWNEKDQTGKEASFLTFVGRSATVVNAGPAPSDTTTSLSVSWPLLGLAATAALGLYAFKRLRKFSTKQPIRPSEALRQKRIDQQPQDEHPTPTDNHDEEDVKTLPNNPADALAELHHRAPPSTPPPS